MIVMKIFPPDSGMSFDMSEVAFFPDEPGIPFGDNLAHQVRRLCHQIGDSKTPALPPIRLLPVTSPEVIEVMEKGGSLISLEK